MLEPILQSLREVEGVQGALIVDRSATVVAQRVHSIYDPAVLQQVARQVGAAVDSVQLLQDDWESLTAHYGDGKLLLRSLRVAGARPQRYVLAVIADTRLNVAFLGVALRVAATKLLAALEAGAPAAGLQTPSFPGIPQTSQGPQGAQSSMRPIEQRADGSRSNLSWSGVGSGSDSGMSSDVGVSDSTSAAYLTACSKALAQAIGPMAKVLVKEAVRKLCGDRPFSRADAPALIAQLAAGIDDADDRKTFERAARKF